MRFLNVIRAMHIVQKRVKNVYNAVNDSGGSKMGNVDNLTLSELIKNAGRAVNKLEEFERARATTQSQQRFYLRLIFERIADSDAIKQMSDSRIITIINALEPMSAEWDEYGNV